MQGRAATSSAPRSRCRSACSLSIARSRLASTGSSAVRCPGTCCVAAARARARCQCICRSATSTCSPTSAENSDGSTLRAAWPRMASGVFSACARFPAWARARSTTSAFRSSTPLNSSMSGCSSFGKLSLQALLPTFPHALQALLHGLQRCQAHGHLGQRRERQQHTEAAERRRKDSGEAIHRGHCLAQVASDHQAPPGLRRLRCLQRALHGAKRLASRPGDVMPVDGPIGQRIVGQGQLGIPQRTGAQHGAVLTRRAWQSLDLPVEARVRLLPARVAHAPRTDDGKALGIELQTRRELVQLLRQGRIELLQHVIAEQPGEPPVGPHQRDDQRRQRGAQQSQAQRAGPRPHGPARR